ncbi:MAG TPA: hypothetical protein DCZ48_07375 [Methylococcaceae bacterium]|nr:hypothetical protein [Methylococcaceae bacterium]
MTETTKIAIAVIGVFVVGFIVVGVSKQESIEEKESAAMIRTYVAMQEMASKKCPAAIMKETGEQVFFPSETKSDKESYVTYNYQGETDAFKNASCTLRIELGGISDLVIDDKVIIKKQKKN